MIGWSGGVANVDEVQIGIGFVGPVSSEGWVRQIQMNLDGVLRSGGL